MTKINIYLATRRRMARYMDLIHRTYYDNNVSWEIKFEIVNDYRHEAIAVLNFSYVLGSMSDSTFENMYDKFVKFVNHYRDKIMKNEW